MLVGWLVGSLALLAAPQSLSSEAAHFWIRSCAIVPPARHQFPKDEEFGVRSVRKSGASELPFVVVVLLVVVVVVASAIMSQAVTNPSTNPTTIHTSCWLSHSSNDQFGASAAPGERQEPLCSAIPRRKRCIIVANSGYIMQIIYILT